MASRQQQKQSTVDISNLQEKAILKSKKSILYNDGSPWSKKGNNFDVAQGSYDGAECAELKIKKKPAVAQKIRNVHQGKDAQKKK